MKTDAELILSDSMRADAMNKLSLKVTSFLNDAGFFQNCYNCQHWLEGPPHNRQQICGLFKARPPTSVIVAGCSEHTDNIPF